MLIHYLSLPHSLSLSLSLIFIQPPEPPVKTNQIPREVPDQSRLSHPVISALMGGILPFGSVFIQLFFIINSLWLVVHGSLNAYMLFVE